MQAEHLEAVGVGLVDADEVEDEFGAAALAQLPDRVDDAVAVDRPVGAQLLGELAAVGMGIDGDHGAGAELAGELQADVADPAGPEDHGGGAGAIRWATFLTAW